MAETTRQQQNASEERDGPLIRPINLLGPEREHLKFHIPTLVGAPPEVIELVEQIKAVAETFLYHWKSFPIVLPSPIVQAVPTESASPELNRKSRAINLRDLFVPPPFDELDAVATDSHGEPRRLTFNQLRSLRDRGLHIKDKQGKAKILNDDQLEAIRLRGEFVVPSVNFPGQFHKWHLSQFLQKGTERTHETLLCDSALAARFIVVTARSRVFGHFFSVKSAAKSLITGILKLCNAVLGLPSLLAQDLDNKLVEERCRYLVAELECRSEFEDYLDTLTTYVRQELRRAETEKFEMECDPALPVPYLFLTPKGLEVDLRLFSKEIMRKALPVVTDILERETRGWFLHFRERLIAELREKKLSDQDIEEEVNEAVMREYLQRVYNSILANETLKSLGDGIPELLVQQAQSVVIMHKALNKINREIKIVKEDHTLNLHEMHPILSRVPPWLRSKQNAAVSLKVQDSTWAHEEAINECAKHNLQQAIYFLSRDLTFTKEREPVLLKELRDAKVPTRNFHWPCRIWSPKSWIIRRNFQGKSEQIPTVISQQTTSIVTPRSDPSQPVFLVEKEKSRMTSTRWPFWRLLNVIMRIWCWTWNLIFFLGVFVPWYSSCGIRALFYIEPFMSDLELSQINGTLFPRKTSVTQTMASRLRDLWRDISKSRSHFESTPDTGFIGKGNTRNLNRVWNYGIKGFLGTVLILVLLPIACLTITTVSLLLALTAPLWVPLLAIGLQVFNAIIYDIDSPDTKGNKIGILWEALIWNIGIGGLLQPLFAILVAIILCPLCAAIIGLVSVTRYTFRMCWDFVTYHVFIKKYGRVPATDSFAVQRIEGPGLNSNYFFLIQPEQAMAALEAKMESDELQAFQKAMEDLIKQPQKDFTKFVDACFGSFSAQLSSSGAYMDLERESKDLLNLLGEKLEKRRNELQIGLPMSSKTKIKMKTMDLKIAIQQSAHLLERFYPDHVIARTHLSMDEFWDSKNLTVGDWAGLAGLMYIDLFSIDFLTPIADDEMTFNLEPHPHLNLSRYTDMVKNSNDLLPDVLGNLYSPRGNIQIKAPFLEISAFNPKSRIMASFRKREKTGSGPTNKPRDKANRFWSRRPWKRQTSTAEAIGKLAIPLLIPHPAHVAILIYNRDSEQPISMELDIFWEILKSIEDCQGLVGSNQLRFRGGAMDCTSSQGSILSQTSDGSHFSSNGSLDGMAGTSETLPCGIVRGEQQQRRSSIELGVAGSGRTVRWTLNNENNTTSSPGNDIVLRFSDGVNTVRVDLASPEDISLGTDSSRAICVFGSTV